MANTVSRYCPSCGAKAKAPAAAFSKPVKCPKCGEVVKFEDYPNVAPESTLIPQPEPQKELIDLAITISLYAVPSLILIGGFLLMAGQGDISVVISIACLAASSLLLTKYFHHRSSIASLLKDLDYHRVLAETRTQDLKQAANLYQGFKTNFDRLVTDRFAEADQKIARRYEKANNRLAAADERHNTVDRLGKRLLSDNVKWISTKLTPSNFTTSSERLMRVIEFCRKHEFEVPDSHEKELLDDLRTGFEDALRKQHAKEEQQRIKARIREEQRAEKELEREMRRIEAEKNAIEKALEAALARAKDEHSDEVDALREKLREAEEKAFRAKSMAQQTKAGHVYVISNIGSFGEGVYKVGMTRRLEPLDRVKELGDASVPFPFDVHMMISCDDAPALENAIHKTLHAMRLNKVNLRREFFRTDLDVIHGLVIENHGEVEYLAEPEALQYRESQGMSDVDFEFISQQSASLEFDDDDGFLED